MADMLSLRIELFKATPAEFAAIGGVDVSTVSRWDNNNLRPSGRAVLRILDAADERGIEVDRGALLAICEAPVKPRQRRPSQEAAA